MSTRIMLLIGLKVILVSIVAYMAVWSGMHIRHANRPIVIYCLTAMAIACIEALAYMVVFGGHMQ